MTGSETELTERYKKEIEILKSLFGEAVEKAGGKGHRFYHQIRVAHYCEKLAKKLGLPDEKIDNLILAALYHDIGKAPRIKEDGTLDGSQKADDKHGDHTDKNHVLSLLKQYLSYLQDERKLSIVSDIIASKELKESKILSDADNLDEVGLVNIWKMFTFGGTCKVSIEETLDYYFKDPSRLVKKAERLFNFECSKKIASERERKVDYVLTKLKEELEGEDIN